MLGETVCKKFPSRPLQKLPTIANTFDFRLGPGTVERKTSSLPMMERQPLPLERQWLQIIGVFGEGAGEAFFAKRASPVVLQRTQSSPVSPRESFSR
jgi:hypothetical protein